MRFPPKKRTVMVFLAVAALACWLPGQAAADGTFTITTGNSALTGGGNFGPYLTVNISVDNSGAATFTLTALNSYKFGGPEGFDVDFTTPVTITGLPSGWSAASAQNQQVDGWGRFDEIIAQGDNNSPVTSLTFIATPISGTFANVFSVLEANSDGNLAAAHISPTTGNTGFASSIGPIIETFPVPLPGAVGLLGSGLLGLGLIGWRRREKQV